ncbi:hypothetical protein [Bradyrhizobium sp.]|jgi:hypothetical protein|uniref:hypothetical protein n=1 Tax=Bradyrhizobium sp. TaxID=376 RepID=UPI002DDC9D56|nr:hypothetical protein [Bradyrhizobium sp.]HEV2160252.1 hypothetical protein [Bradyrhizobium sp.]
MDWKDVGKIVAPLAPTLGGILGDLIPIPGGGMIGTAAGNILAAALGVDPTPDAVGAAIQNDPNAAAKISAAETEAGAKWPALAEIAKAQFQANATEAESINATMRQELAAGQKWYAWRNLYGYSVGFEATATSWVILYALVFRPDIVRAVQDSLSFFLSWYGMRFGLLGYIHNQATVEKVAAVTGTQPDGVVKSVIKAVTGKK